MGGGQGWEEVRGLVEGLKVRVQRIIPVFLLQCEWAIGSSERNTSQFRRRHSFHCYQGR